MHKGNKFNYAYLILEVHDKEFVFGFYDFDKLGVN